jgi:hypothetical protein
MVTGKFYYSQFIIFELKLKVIISIEFTYHKDRKLSPIYYRETEKVTNFQINGCLKKRKPVIHGELQVP